jgi:lysophospholipase L1-like esterase
MEGAGFLKLIYRKTLLPGSLLSLAYISYLIWQFQTYGWWVVKWHTHIALPFMLFIIGSIFLRIIEITFRKSFYSAMVVWLICCWVLLAVEIIFLLTGVSILLNDKRWGGYTGTDFVPMKTRYYHKWTPGINVNIKKKEFTHIRKINSQGYPDYEWATEKSDSIFRVICLGDSFTEGEGADYSESYVAQLRLLWQKNDVRQVEILNAGVCGSDPFYNFIDYKDRLYAYQPDLIIQTISSHDIVHDIFQRGGIERFTAKNGIYRPDFQLWQVFFVCNYSFRIIITSVMKANQIIKYDILKKSSSKSDTLILDLLDTWKSHLEKDSIPLFVVFLPGHLELRKGCYYHNMNTLQKGLSDRNIPSTDLTACYLKTTDQAKHAKDYFWPIDQHHNAKGYQMMAECIYEGLKEKGLIED